MLLTCYILRAVLGIAIRWSVAHPWLRLPVSSLFNEAKTGNEFLTGDSTAELICANDGADTVHAAGGDDEIYGNQGNDRIFGETGDDRLFGGQNGGPPTEDAYGRERQQQGTETVSTGGSGDDLIYGNYGSDSLEGGLGADTVFALNTGNTFDDFSPDLDGDRIATVGGFADLTLENTAAGLELDWNALTGSASMTLAGWTASDFSSDWLA